MQEGAKLSSISRSRCSSVKSVSRSRIVFDLICSRRYTGEVKGEVGGGDRVFNRFNYDAGFSRSLVSSCSYGVDIR